MSFSKEKIHLSEQTVSSISEFFRAFDRAMRSEEISRDVLGESLWQSFYGIHRVASQFSAENHDPEQLQLEISSFINCLETNISKYMLLKSSSLNGQDMVLDDIFTAFLQIESSFATIENRDVIFPIASRIKWYQMYMRLLAIDQQISQNYKRHKVFEFVIPHSKPAGAPFRSWLAGAHSSELYVSDGRPTLRFVFPKRLVESPTPESQAFSFEHRTELLAKMRSLGLSGAQKTTVGIGIDPNQQRLFFQVNESSIIDFQRAWALLRGDFFRDGQLESLPDFSPMVLQSLDTLKAGEPPETLWDLVQVRRTERGLIELSIPLSESASFDKIIHFLAML